MTGTGIDTLRSFLVLALFSTARPVAGQCPEWRPGFGLPGSDQAIHCLAVFDDGGRPALYAGGQFTMTGNELALFIAKWNGSRWSALGSGMNGYVFALAVYDDGNGPALYAGGSFTTAGDVSARYIAKWNGTSWSPLGSGMNVVAGGGVYALAVYDDGGGPALYAGGSFTTAGSVTANGMAQWNGTSWSSLGSGVSGGYDRVEALAVYDDGNGPALYAGGGFTNAGGVSVNNIAKWDGVGWSPLGSGVDGGVSALKVFDDGSGPALFVGGAFANGGHVGARGVAKWNGTNWYALGGGLESVLALEAYDGGGGQSLYAGGLIYLASGQLLRNIGRWDGTSWRALPGGNGLWSSRGATAFAVYDDGGGPALYVGGFGTFAGVVHVNGIARWNGASWSSLGSGLNGNGYITALAVYDDGSVQALYAGGNFTGAGGVSAYNIAKWSGTSWSAVDNGMDYPVHALAVYDDGHGPALYAGGVFTQAGSASVANIAKWNGTRWSPLGSGMNASVSALAVFDDGNGPALYAGGMFTIAGSTVANHVARWNGTSWSPLGIGLNGPGSTDVSALAAYDDGTGPALFAGGAFTTAGGPPAHFIAKWNGTSWSTLSIGVNGPVYALAVYDDGDGPALYAGGEFTFAGGISAHCVAKWDGTMWSHLGGGLSGGITPAVMALSAHDDGSGPALYAGGEFTNTDSFPSLGIAIWRGCGTGSPAVDFCVPGLAGVATCPCGNPQVPAGSTRGCNNSSVTGGARLTSHGVASLAGDTVRFIARAEKPRALSIFLQGNAAISGGLSFGQGVRCAGGSIKRLYVHNASGGVVAAGYGVGSDLPVHARSATLGDSIQAGTTREYQVYYRDPNVIGGCPKSSTFNATQGQRITWTR